MKKSIMCVMLAFLFVFALQTRGSALHEEDGRIVDKLVAGNGIAITISMPIPGTPPISIDQTKLKRLQLDKSKISELIALYCQVNTGKNSNNKWLLELGGPSYPSWSVYYYPTKSGYGLNIADYTDMEWPLDTADSQLTQADSVVKDFMDALAIPYEYPFYACLYDYQRLLGSSLHPISKEGYLNSGWGLPGQISKDWESTDGPCASVVVRFRLNDIPFGTTITWTKGSDTAGDGNATPSAFFTVLPNGKISSIIIRNAFDVSKTQPDFRPILDWERILTDAVPHITDLFCTGEDLGNTLTLIKTEFLLFTDQNSIVFPAWSFVFERKFSPPSTYMDALRLSYDARTGEQVW